MNDSHARISFQVRTKGIELYKRVSFIVICIAMAASSCLCPVFSRALDKWIESQECSQKRQNKIRYKLTKFSIEEPFDSMLW